MSRNRPTPTFATVLRRSLLLGSVFLGAWLGGCDGSTQDSAASAQSSEEEPRLVRYDAAASQALLNAAAAGDSERATEALKQGADPNARREDDRTPLMLAAFDGHTAIVIELLDHGAEVDARDPVGRTSLMYASSGPFEATVRTLLENGADPHAVDSEERFTALMFAAGEGLTEVVQLLLDSGSDPSTVDADGDTALDHATRSGRAEVVAMLTANQSSD